MARSLSSNFQRSSLDRFLKIPSTTLAFFSITVVAVLGILPLIIHGSPMGHDALFHMKWVQNFSRQFWSGDFYPRWLAGMNQGLGSPAFFFYGPVPYWVASLLGPPSIVGSGWIRLSLCAFIGLWLSGISAFCWLRSTCHPAPSLAGAVLYMLLPYHLITDLYLRFALSEFWAFGWFPLVLLFIRHLARGQTKAISGLAFSLALLAMTHLLSFVIFFPLAVAYYLLKAGPAFRKHLLRLCIACVLAAGLSSIYILPLAATKRFVLLDEVFQHIFPYKDHFLFRGLPFAAERFIDFTSMVGLLTLLIALLSYASARNHRPDLKETLFWVSVALAAVLMSSPASAPIWRTLPFLPHLQFPYRFLALLTLCAAILFSHAIEIYVSEPSKRGLIPGMLLGAVVFGVVLHSSAFLVQTMFTKATDFQPERIKTTTENALEVPEYWTTWSKEIVGKSLEDDRLPFEAKTLSILDGAGSVSLIRWDAGKVVFRTASDSATIVQIKQFYFPNWQAQTIEGNNPVIRIAPSEKTGLITLKIKPGAHRIELRFSRTPMENLGLLLSALCLLGVSLFYFRYNPSGA